MFRSFLVSSRPIVNPCRKTLRVVFDLCFEQKFLLPKRQSHYKNHTGANCSSKQQNRGSRAHALGIQMAPRLDRIQHRLRKPPRRRVPSEYHGIHRSHTGKLGCAHTEAKNHICVPFLCHRCAECRASRTRVIRQLGHIPREENRVAKRFQFSLQGLTNQVGVARRCIAASACTIPPPIHTGINQNPLDHMYRSPFPQDVVTSFFTILCGRGLD